MFIAIILLAHCGVFIHDASAQEKVNETQRCFLIKPESALALGCEPEWKTPFFWYYGKDETRYLPKSHVELRASQLLFHGVQLSDAGRYICRSVKDPLVETTYHLVTPILSQREPVWTKVALIGSSAIIDCDFVADPQPHIEWFIGNDHAELKKRAHHRVHISSNPDTSVPNSRLIVQNVNTADNNAYTCRASHLMCGLQTEQVAMLRAQQSEILTNEAETEYGFHGVLVNPKSQKLVLKCNYTGERYWNEESEPPTYEWYKNQTMITESSKYHIQNEGPASTLTVSSCDVSDAGNYSCKFNKKQEATLAVYMYPTIDHVEGSKIQVQGDPLTLLCKARGAPTPTVTWYKEDSQLEPDERIELHELDGVANAKLIIKDLQYEDKGHYSCKAKAANVTRSVDIHVRVKDKYAALWPFLGICAEVAILCTIIFIYERRRTKPEFEDDDDKKESTSRK